MKYIKNGRIVMPDRIIDGKVLAYDGQISGYINAGDIPEGAEVIDAQGNYVCPGFVDIHIHGYLNEDTSDGNPEGIRKMAYGIAENGVTSFLPTTMTVSEEEIVAALNAVRSLKKESETWGGAEILGVHAEGPFINPSKKGAQKEECIQKPNAKFLLDNADIIRHVTLAPEMDEGHEAIKEVARNSDILISMGHPAAGYEEAVSAVADGVSHATHLFNAMTPLAHRDPGVVGAAFHIGVEQATELRLAQPWIIWLLPVGGVVIVGLYRLAHMEGRGTNNIIESVHFGKDVPILLVPLIFISTCITHLLGGSAGREGAALQIGGCRRGRASGRKRPAAGHVVRHERRVRRPVRHTADGHRVRTGGH